MDEKIKKYILAFHQFGFGERFINFLLKKCDNDFIPYLWDKGNIEDIYTIFPDIRMQKISDWDKRNRNLPNELFEILSINSIQYLFSNESNYPYLLSQIFDPPPILYYKGNLGALDSIKSLAVIGSRKMTTYGKKCIDYLLPEIISSGVSIVSGLALGIDAYAHEVTLKNKGKAIAIIGSGLSICYPSQNEWLYREIIENGGVIFSPFSFDIQSFPYNFPMRNRIISGLSHGVLIVEAQEKSGTIITAKSAIEQGRDVFVVPGDIFRELSVGTNELWKEGAIPVSKSSDILKFMGFDTDNKSSVRNQNKIINDEYKEIWDILSDPMNLDDLVHLSKINIIELQANLSQMEILGIVSLENGLFRRL